MSSKLNVWAVKIERADGRRFVARVYATCKTGAEKAARERLGFQTSGTIVYVKNTGK